MLTIKEKVKTLLGREPEVEEVTFQGKKGFLPLYFNYAFKNSVSEVFAETEEEALKNFYDYLIKKGDTNGTDTESTESSSTKDKGPRGA